LSTRQQVPTAVEKKDTDSGPGYPYSKLHYWSCGALTSNRIGKSRGTLPSSHAGKKAAQVQEVRKTQEPTENGLVNGAAAIQAASARAASGSGGASPAPQWGYGGGDATGQGNGSDDRDEGFVEQHCEEGESSSDGSLCLAES
jgi:hypothetical protein